MLITDIRFDENACRNAETPDPQVFLKQGLFIGNADDNEIRMREIAGMEVVSGFVAGMSGLDDHLLGGKVRTDQDVAVKFFRNLGFGEQRHESSPFV